MKKRHLSPPRFAAWILNKLQGYEQQYVILGDIEEVYKRIAESENVYKARLWYWSQTLQSIAPYFNFSLVKHMSLFKNYVKMTGRVLWKHKGYSFINVLGLAVGMASGLFIFQYVSFEMSFDSFHKNGKNIYRLSTNYIRHGKTIYDSAKNFPGVGPVLKETFDEVTDAARIYKPDADLNTTVSFNAQGKNLSYKNEKILYGDANIFSMFSFDLVDGDPEHVLAEPKSVVVTASLAKKYFGSEHAVGKTIRVFNNRMFEDVLTVTGIARDVPANSHLQFDLMISLSTMFLRFEGAVDRYDKTWFYQPPYYTYIALLPGSTPEDIQPGFQSLVETNKPEFKEVNQSGERIRRNNFSAMPLSRIHLFSEYYDEAGVNGDWKVVLILSIIGGFILIITWINYVNLTTARAMERAKEVAIRKNAGATASNLLYQFVFEAVAVNVLAAIAAGLILVSAIPYLSPLTGQSFAGSLTGNMENLVAFAGIMVLGAIASGVYPSMIMSSFKPASVLKGKLSASKRGVLFRRSLVVFQLAASITLITGTVVVSSQLDFMFDQDLGFSKEQVLVIERPVVQGQNRKAVQKSLKILAQETSQLSSVSSVTGSSSIPGKNILRGLAARKSGTTSPDDLLSINDIYVEPNFVKTFQMQLLAGRDFDAKIISDSAAVIFNESALNLLGFTDAENAVSQYAIVAGQPRKIIGVIKDYNHDSLHKPKNPTMFLMDNNHPKEYTSVKMSTGNILDTIQQVKTLHSSIFPGSEFTYFFLDDFFNAQYNADRKFRAIFFLFTTLAIFVTSLGLFGLLSYLTQQRTKEIGIRKVLGAKVFNVIYLLLKEVIVFGIVANVIAWPIGWYMMGQWLQNFSYRIDLSIFVFVFGGGLTLLIMLLTVSFQTVRAALASPVTSLKYE